MPETGLCSADVFKMKSEKILTADSKQSFSSTEELCDVYTLQKLWLCFKMPLLRCFADVPFHEERLYALLRLYSKEPGALSEM